MRHGLQVKTLNRVGAGATAALVLAAVAGCADARPQPAPNILLISVDTLRADRLGAYGYPRPTSPNLDALAREGVLVRDVLTPSTTTRLAHRAILRGTLAAAGDRSPTLATLLKQAGYATAAFVDGGFMRARFGHDEGFHVYVDDLARPAPAGARPVADREGGGFEAILPRAEAWLRASPDRPWFLFLHSYDVHCPYTPPVEDAELFTGGRAAPLDTTGLCGLSDLQGMELDREALDWIRDLYDGGVHHADRLLGRFIRSIRAAGHLENTILAVISDHGESLGEAGWIGHNRLMPPQMRVPWLLHGAPFPAGHSVDGPAHLLDLVPTLLDYAGLQPPPGLAGISLRPAVGGARALPADRLRVVETRRGRALVQDGWMLVQDNETGQTRDLHPWPDASKRPPAGARLQAETRLREAWEQLALSLEIEPGVLDEALIPEAGAVRQELRSLGYVD